LNREDLKINFDNQKNKHMKIEVHKRAKRAFVLTLSLLKGVYEGTLFDPLPEAGLALFRMAIKKGGYVPIGFFSEFEKGQLRFNVLGGLS